MKESTKFSPEVRERAVRKMQEQLGQYPPQRATGAVTLELSDSLCQSHQPTLEGLQGRQTCRVGWIDQVVALGIAPGPWGHARQSPGLHHVFGHVRWQQHH